MDLLKIFSDIATPVIVFILGITFLRKVEAIKKEVAKESDFDSRWASLFFEACNDFMEKVERYMVLLYQIQMLDNKNGETSSFYQKEMTELNPKIEEIELKIRRLAGFAPLNGKKTDEKAVEIQGELVNLIEKGGSFDDLFDKIKEFCSLAKSAHAEMLNPSKTSFSRRRL